MAGNVALMVSPSLRNWLLQACFAGDTKLLAWLKAKYASGLLKVLDRPRPAIAGGCLAVLLAAAAVPFFPTTFLPPFNEGTLLVGMRLNPGVTLGESVALARQAEVLIKQVPEVVHVGAGVGVVVRVGSEVPHVGAKVGQGMAERDGVAEAAERGRRPAAQRLQGRRLAVAVDQPHRLVRRLDHRHAWRQPPHLPA